MADDSSIQTLIGLIRNARIDLSSEKRAQADVEQILTQAGIAFDRECPLTESDIIDFIVEDVGIELKLKGARKKEIYRQLCRYAGHPRVGSLILASNLSMGLPAQIEGKDTFFVRLGEAWL